MASQAARFFISSGFFALLLATLQLIVQADNLQSLSSKSLIDGVQVGSDQIGSASFHNEQHWSLSDQSLIAGGSLNLSNHSENQATAEQPLQPSSSSLKFRVNVSNICEKDRMQITVRLNKPFYGLIHAKEKRKKSSCSLDGNGSQAYTFHMSYTQVQSDPDYCGVVAHPPSSQLAPQLSSDLDSSSTGLNGRRQSPHLIQGQSNQTLSLVLVVRLHKTIEFSEDRYFLLSCANRCSRPDCSTNPGRQLDLASSGQRASANLLTVSESIVSPKLFRPRDDSIPSTSISTFESQNRPNSVCDRQMSIKLQWLIRISLLLGFLLVALGLIVLYLCCRIRDVGRQKIPESCEDLQKENKVEQEKQPRKQLQKQAPPPPPPPPPNVPIQVRANSLIEPWQTVANRSALNDESRFMMQCEMQDRQQQLTHNNQQPRFVTIHGNPITELHHHHQMDQTSPEVRSMTLSQQPTVMGRSLETFGRVQRRLIKSPADQIIRRRRSIGGTSLGAQVLDSQQRIQQHQQNQQEQIESDQTVRLPNSDHFNTSLRAKSKSQTTIFYEQGQDPFKSVPFSYLKSNSYVPDGHSNGMDLNNNNTTGPEYELMSPNRDYHCQEQRFTMGHNSNSSNHHDARHQQQQVIEGPVCLLKGSARYLGQPTEIAYLGHHHQPQQQHHHQSSQFDPRSSRQLADLIKQKHQKQIEHANLTAASLQQAQNNMAMNQLQQMRTNFGQQQCDWQ